MGCSRGLDGRGPGGAHPPHRHAAPGLCWADGRRLLWTRSLRGGAPRGEEAGTAREPSSPSIHAAQVLGCPHGQAVRHLTAGGRSRPPHRDERDGWRARCCHSHTRPRAMCSRFYFLQRGSEGEREEKHQSGAGLPVACLQGDLEWRE